MTPRLPALPPDHRQARDAKRLRAARADVIAFILAILQLIGDEVVVADAAAGAVRQAGDGAVALEDPAQVVDERAYFPADLRTLRQALALAELARWDRQVRQLGGVVDFLRAGVVATVVWPLGYPLGYSLGYSLWWPRCGCAAVAGLALVERRRSLTRYWTWRRIPAILP